MAVGEDVGRFIARFIGTLKAEEIEWQKRNQEDILNLRERKQVREKEIEQKLQAMEVRFKGDLKRIEMDEGRKTKEFSDFLDSIEEMKTKMLQTYVKMPRPLGLMFHHHAAELLKEAWDNPDARERLKQQTNFMELMLAASSDLTEQKPLPEKTLKLLREPYKT